MQDPIGAVFTPLELGTWAAQTSGLVDLWLSGGTILDPTCGSGNLLLALAQAVRDRGLSVTPSMASRLFGLDLVPGFVDQVHNRWEAQGYPPLDRRQFLTGDILTLPRPSWPLMDGIFANPPWITFADLSSDFQRRWAPVFQAQGLVSARHKVLLGNSRGDLAALVWAKVQSEYLKPGGMMGIFAPLSLLFGTGAQEGFRQILASQTCWQGLWDWEISPFPEISTRWGFYLLHKAPGSPDPVPYHLVTRAGTQVWEAKPWPGPTSPWVAAPRGSLPPFTPLSLPPGVQCRQGVNTGGANQAFLLPEIPREAARWAYPLAPPRDSQTPGKSKPRGLLLFHDPNTGKPFSAQEMEEFFATSFGTRWKAAWEGPLRSRKGKLLGATLARGQWWTVLGLGPYTFKPWKIVWESFGTKTFLPRLEGPQDGKPIIPFQALQTYLSFDSRSQAQEILARLQALPVVDYLRASRLGNGQSGAQPGRMAPFFLKAGRPGGTDPEPGL